MALRSPTFRVRARGPYACFTRPEFKADRVSYEVMTPSAARGLLEAILWKPALRWLVERIHVLAPIRFIALKRNEVTDKASTRAGLFFADERRAQRNSLLLRDVDYVIEAHFELTSRAGPDDNLRKFVDMFSRRLANGQCFHAPYLGCREFVARVEPAPADWLVPPELADERDLGLVLHDLDFAPDGSGSARPYFFPAVLQRGLMAVPEAMR
jgi:CRISPR-associated protein Cas5d